MLTYPTCSPPLSASVSWPPPTPCAGRCSRSPGGQSSTPYKGLSYCEGSVNCLFSRKLDWDKLSVGVVKPDHTLASLRVLRAEGDDDVLIIILIFKVVTLIFWDDLKP